MVVAILVTYPCQMRRPLRQQQQLQVPQQAWQPTEAGSATGMTRLYIFPLLHLLLLLLLPSVVAAMEQHR
jgi:hypothetical protein